MEMIATGGSYRVCLHAPDEPRMCGAGEDDGHLLLYVYYAEEGVSKLHVYDAKTMAQQPVAVVSMRRRVPFGFHGTFVREPLLQQS
jgi:carotenoid cleavage dioxygenase-like enzyme